MTQTIAPNGLNAVPTNGVDLLVTSRRTVATNVVELVLSHPAGERLPDWAPGSHIDLVLPTGQVRQYSLCGDRWDASTYRIGVLREPEGRGGSASIHDDLTVGSIVGLGGPRNNFALVPSERYLFVAGGIGITPILPMIESAERLGADWTLLYGGRTRASMAFTDELEQYGERVQLFPQDETGLLPLTSWLTEVDATTNVYCCGPEPLLRALGDATSHWPAHRVRIERFVAKDQGAPVRAASFEVELARNGSIVTVQPDVSVLDAVRAIGVNVLSSCQEGTCGTCETDVLAGTPDHRDSLMDDEERGRCDRMFICVSRSCSDRLVLDL